MKKNFFMLLAAAALVSCSTSEMNEPDAISGSLISLKSTTSTTDGTRAPFEGTVSATNPLTAFVPSSTVSGDYTSANLHTEGTMTFNNASSSVASTYNAASLIDPSKVAFPASEKVWLFGLHPATGWNLGTDCADIEFIGKEDVMGAQEVEVTLADVEKNKYETLAFKHLLTKLDVKFMAEAGAISTVGQIRLVQWVADATGAGVLNNKVTYTPNALPANPLATFATTAAKALSFYGATETSGVRTYTDVAYENQTYVLTTASTLQAYAMVAPVDAKIDVEAEYFIKVVWENGSEIIPVDLMNVNGTAFTGYTAGNAFSVVVNYTKDEIKAVGTVTPWIENGEYVANVTVN